MTEISVVNVGTPKCPGCEMIPPPRFNKVGRFELLRCEGCNTTFVIIEQSSLITTMKVDLNVPETPIPE